MSRSRTTTLPPRVFGHARGFTLLELIVAVAVMGILAVLAVPAFQYVAANTKIKSATSNLHLALLKARSEAVKRDTTVTLTATGSAWHNGWTMTSGANTLQAQEALKGVAVTVEPAVTSITFQSSGRPATGRAKFQITPDYRNQAERVDEDVEDELVRCVTIQPNGAATIREATCPPP